MHGENYSLMKHQNWIDIFSLFHLDMWVFWQTPPPPPPPPPSPPPIWRSYKRKNRLLMNIDISPDRKMGNLCWIISDYQVCIVPNWLMERKRFIIFDMCIFRQTSLALSTSLSEFFFYYYYFYFSFSELCSEGLLIIVADGSHQTLSISCSAHAAPN